MLVNGGGILGGGMCTGIFFFLSLKHYILVKEAREVVALLGSCPPPVLVCIPLGIYPHLALTPGLG